MVTLTAGLVGDDYRVTRALAATPHDAGETFEDGWYECCSRIADQRRKRSAADPTTSAPAFSRVQYGRLWPRAR